MVCSGERRDERQRDEGLFLRRSVACMVDTYAPARTLSFRGGSSRIDTHVQLGPLYRDDIRTVPPVRVPLGSTLGFPYFLHCNQSRTSRRKRMVLL